MKKICLLALAIFFVPAVFAAATAQLVSLQGYATDSADNPLATGDVAVRIYSTATDGSLVYNSGTDFNNAISNGVFDVMLGGVTPLSLDNKIKYYMEIDVNGQEVVGDANAGRRAFWPGGGDHTHTHPASEITGSINADTLDGYHSYNFKSYLSCTTRQSYSSTGGSSVECASDEKATGGGGYCLNGGASISQSYPSSTSSWTLTCTSGGTDVFATCCKLM